MFTLVSDTPFPELKLTAKLYRHDCGMQVLSLESADAENLFALCFSTVPSDDTGVPHIIEHSVLEGSRSYPVKDPFVCMLKTSVATFINAMTFPDRTIYPCTSCCKKDYFNLFEVYWDAVFHPQLTRETFAQEGWHYEVKGAGKKQKLMRNGIVLNEMSGYYSDPGTVLGREIEHGLFGKGPMRYDSGGDPQRIYKLTYHKFLEFYRRHYNHSVTRVVLYGNIPTEEKLAFIEEHLKRDLTERDMANVSVAQPSRPEISPMCPLPSAPRTIRRGFVPDQEAGKSGKGIFALAWALDQTRDPELDLAFQLLDAVLFNNSGAPLKKALQSSRLCSSIMATGYDNETRYTTFEVALRGVKKADFDKLDALITDKLRELADNGIPRECLDAAVSDFLLSIRGVDSKFVIGLLDDVCASWMYGDDPYIFLRQCGATNALREKLANEPRYLENIIRKWLLENPARVRVEMLPDRDMKRRLEAENSRELAAELAKWSPAKIESTRAFQKRLEERALRQDSPEALATLPVLRHSDLDAKVPEMPFSDGHCASGLPLRRGELFANGISRVNLLADASTLPQELLPYLPLFTSLFRRMGNARLSYDRMAAKCASLGAGYFIGTGTSISPVDKDRRRMLLKIAFTALDENFEEAIALLREQCQTVDFTDRRRLTDCLRELATLAATSLNGRGVLGRGVARCFAGLSPLGYACELLGGVTDYRMMRRMAKATVAELDSFCEKLQAIAQWLRNAPLISAGFVGGDNELKAVDVFASQWNASALQNAVDIPASVVGMEEIPAVGRCEFGQIPTQVNTCIRGLAGPHRTDADYAATMVGVSMLSRGYMWDEIRAKGGAYGTGMSYDGTQCCIELFSSEDPKPENTRKVFDAVLDFVKGHTFTRDEIDKAILSCAGKYFRPVRPVGLSALCVNTLLDGIGNAELQHDYEALLAVRPEQVRAALLSRLDLATVPHNDFIFGPVPCKGTTPVEIS